MRTSRLVVYFFMVWVVVSCRNDDGDLNPGTVVPPQTLTETEIENDAEIVAYLQTHFYNYEEFETPPAEFDFKVRFDTIAGANSAKKPIIDDIKTETVLVESSFFGRTDGEEVQHTLYYLEIDGFGAGERPTIGDNSIMQYEGLLLDGTLFDASSNNPVVFYLSDPGLRLGFARAMTKLKTGIGPVENGDGTISYNDFGIGAVFMPSGLAYFSAPPTGIPAYAPLIFTLQAMSFEKDTDFDGDGIPSILEDVDGDGNLNNDNTDADTEPFSIFLANHNDTDDDDDGIPTIEEIELDAEGNFVGFKDTDGDGISDHLDNDN